MVDQSEKLVSESNLAEEFALALETWMIFRGVMLDPQTGNSFFLAKESAGWSACEGYAKVLRKVFG